MSYRISSKRFDNSWLSDLLKILVNYFQIAGIEFYVIGAAARDIVLGGIHNRKTGRKTRDLDIAIMIADWDKFEQIAEELCGMSEFKRSERQKQRFHFKDNLILDIVPFGKIAQSDRNIYWPPDETHAMSVSGFTEMANKALSVTIDGEYTILVASVPGIFILKLYAWKDRNKQTNKDAEDIALLLNEYLEINVDRAVEEHYDIYEQEDFDTFGTGAILMGRDVKTMLAENSELLIELIEIIGSEITKAESSILINQMLETHPSRKYGEVYNALVKLADEFKR